MDERSAQRYLEDLTPGGSEYVDNPKRCYEWVQERLDNNQRLLVRAHLESNRLRDAILAALSALIEQHDRDGAERILSASLTVGRRPTSRPL